jgi:hypothetical protein
MSSVPATVVAAFPGGIRVSAFALRRRTAG